LNEENIPHNHGNERNQEVSNSFLSHENHREVFSAKD